MKNTHYFTKKNKQHFVAFIRNTRVELAYFKTQISENIKNWTLRPVQNLTPVYMAKQINHLFYRCPALIADDSTCDASTCQKMVCACPAGTVDNGKTCVPKSECGCNVDGKMIAVSSLVWHCSIFGLHILTKLKQLIATSQPLISLFLKKPS